MDRLIVPTRRLFLGSAALGSLGLFAPGAFAEELTKTPKQTEGPFYPTKLPLDTDNDLLIINDGINPGVGTITHLTGKVLDIKGNPIRNALVILGVLVYCVWRLPRDPSTFRRSKDQAKVVRYYTNLPGGLDFSTLIRLSKKDGAQAVYLATGVNVHEIQKRLDELVPFRTAESQIAWWTSLALDMHTEMDRMNGILGKGGQGINRRVLFDVQFGGYLFQYLRPPEVGEDYLFAFAATLVQAEVNTRRFEEHFELMITALRNIKAGMEKV